MSDTFRNAIDAWRLEHNRVNLATRQRVPWLDETLASIFDILRDEPLFTFGTSSPDLQQLLTSQSDSELLESFLLQTTTDATRLAFAIQPVAWDLQQMFSNAEAYDTEPNAVAMKERPAVFALSHYGALKDITL